MVYSLPFVWAPVVSNNPAKIWPLFWNPKYATAHQALFGGGEPKIGRTMIPFYSWHNFKMRTKHKNAYWCVHHCCCSLCCYQTAKACNLCVYTLNPETTIGVYSTLSFFYIFSPKPLRIFRKKLGRPRGFNMR